MLQKSIFFGILTSIDALQVPRDAPPEPRALWRRVAASKHSSTKDEQTAAKHSAASDKQAVCEDSDACLLARWTSRDDYACAPYATFCEHDAYGIAMKACCPESCGMCEDLLIETDGEREPLLKSDVEDVMSITEESENTADDFICSESLEDQVQLFFEEKNGEQVKKWHENYGWPMSLRINANASCTPKAYQGGVTDNPRINVIFSDPVDSNFKHPYLRCCENNNSDANVQKWEMGSSFFSVQSWRGPGSEKDYYFEWVIPEVCQPESENSKAPCPMLVSLGVVHFVGDAQYCSGCREELGVVQLMLYTDEVWQMMHNEWVEQPWLKDHYVRNLTEQFMSNNTQIVDKNRVYIVGTSVGGAGALTAGLTHPDLFSRIFASGPLSYYGDGVSLSPRNIVAVPNEREFGRFGHYFEKGLQKQKALTNITIFMGGQEGIIDNWVEGEVDWSRLPVRIAKVGVDKTVYTEYRVYPEYPHCTWGPAFNDFYEIVWQGI